MNAKNSSAFYENDSELVSRYESTNVIPEQENDIELIEESEKKQRLLSILLADIKWTINSEGKVSYISPFIENCIGNDAKYVIKKIVSRYLTQSSVIACLIELEELTEIIRTSKNARSRTLVVDTVDNDYNIKNVEITSSAIFDLQGNIIGIQGLCLYLQNNTLRY